MTAAAAKISCRIDRCAVARPSMESPREAIPTCRPAKEIGVVYSMRRRPSRTTSSARVSPNVPSGSSGGTGRYGFPLSVTRSWATTMSEVSRMETKAISGSLALVSDTSRSSPSGSFDSRECPAESATTREIAAPRWSRSRRRVAFGHLRDRPGHGDDQEEDEGEQEPEQFQADPYPDPPFDFHRTGLFFHGIHCDPYII